MSLGAIAFVLVKAVVRKLFVVLPHDPIAANFGDDAGCCYGSDEAITTDDSFLLDRELFDGEFAVD